MSVCLVEYKNYINEEKIPVGHGLKYIKEVDSLLGNNTTVACSQDYKISDNELRLPYSCSNKYDNKVEKIKNVLKKIINIMVALLKSKDDIIWFTNVDWVIFFVLGIFKLKRKVVITAYTTREKLCSKCPRILFNRAFSKVSLVIKTNPNLDFECESVFLPDFFYDNRYLQYKKNFKDKKNAILIIGTIREEKDIIGAVYILNSLDFEALICGKFYNQDIYEECVRIARNNIKIENRIVPEEEYLNLISDYKYVFLPYKNNYQLATSGVLLECIFMGSLPIAPNFLLDFNGIDGVGYDKLEDIFHEIVCVDEMEILNTNNSLLESYKFDLILERLEQSLNSILKSEKCGGD